MAVLRRGVQVVALVGTLLVGTIALVLIVSQTGWFRDWVRRYIVREAAQYLNGELSIGQLRGNLFFGAELADVAVNLGGERIIAVKSLGVDYSVLDLVSKGLVIDDIRIDQPRVVIRRTPDGWNFGRLVKEQRREAEREGPMRPVTIGSIGISGGDFALQGVGTAGTFEAPRRLRDVDARLSFQYEPVHYTVEVGHLSFNAVSPDLSLKQLMGKVAVRDDNLYVEDMIVRTAESDLQVEGVVERYLRQPVIKLNTGSGGLSLPEVARVAPAVGGIRLRPAFDVEANGPLDRLALTLSTRSAAGSVNGSATVDLDGPVRAAEGTLNVRDLNLAGFTGRPALASRLTGKTTFDLTMPAGGWDAMAGPFTFTGPRAAIAGYDAQDVQVRAKLDGPRIQVEGRARGYGGASTVRGTIVRPYQARALTLDLRGSASGVDLRRLPKSLNVPQLVSELAADWHVRKESCCLVGEAVLGHSRIEGAEFASGTTAMLEVEGERIEYAAKGAVTGLDLQRFGAALNLAALAADRFGSSLTGPFEINGSGKSFETTTIDASGELVDSRLFGAEFPGLRYTARLDHGALAATAAGTFSGLDPAVLTARPETKGLLAGQMDVRTEIDDVKAQVRPETLAAAGRVELARSTIGGLDIEKAVIDGRVDRGKGELRSVDISGADLHLTASGPIALTATGASNVEYHVDTPSLDEIGRLVGRPLAGAVIVDGRLTGNRAELKTTGTLSGSNVRYGDNGALDVTAQYSMSVPNLSFSDATLEATTTATFVKAGGVELRELTGEATYKAQTLEFDTTVKDRGREASGKGTLVIHADHNELHVPSLVLRAEGQEWRLAGGEAVIQFDAREIRVKGVELAAAAAGNQAGGAQSLAVEGSIARTGTSDSDLRIKASSVDIAQLEKLALADRGFAGLLSADARVTGSLDAPRIEGSVAVNQGKFRTFAFESLTAKLDYRSNGVQLDARLQQNAAQWLTAKGFAPMTLFRFEPTPHAEHVEETPADRIDLRIESSPVDLGIVQGFTSQVTEVKGTLRANVHVTGSGRDPHLEGAITVQGGAFKVPFGGVVYTGLDTRIDLAPEKIVVSGFEVRDDHGNPLLVTGELATHERSVGAVNLQLQSDKFELIDNAFGDVEVDSRLRVTGEFRRPRVEGDVEITAGRIEVDRLLAEFASGPYSTESAPALEVEPGVRVAASSGGAREATVQALGAAADGAAPILPVEPLPSEPQPGVFNQLALNVRLVAPNNLVLRGADLRPGGRGGLALGDINLTVGADLRVQKKPGGGVTIVGTVNTVRGFYQFQGRQFDVTRDGRIRFVGLPVINPLIDVTAEREISGVVTRVHVRGTARRPELTLSSSPPLDEADILSLIVFNQPINNLGTDEQISLAQRAGAIASGFVAAPLAESIGRALDVDLFQIETMSEAAGFGASLTLGQQVNEHLFLKFRQHFGPQDASEFIMEYQVARFLRMQGSVAPGGGTKANRTIQRRIERGAADLIFFFSY